MAMPVKMRKKPLLLAHGQSELDNEHSPIRFQDPSYLTDTLLPCFSRQMMQHDRAQDGIELRSAKWQRLRYAVPEQDLDVGLSRLLARSRNHFGRRIDAVDHSCVCNIPLGCDREAARPATNIEDALTASKPHEVKQPFSERSLSTACCQPYLHIVENGRMQ
jgi:hypothetical protein